jgi:hypothetical protein
VSRSSIGSFSCSVSANWPVEPVFVSLAIVMMLLLFYFVYLVITIF